LNECGLEYIYDSIYNEKRKQREEALTDGDRVCNLLDDMGSRELVERCSTHNAEKRRRTTWYAFKKNFLDNYFLKISRVEKEAQIHMLYHGNTSVGKQTANFKKFFKYFRYFQYQADKEYLCERFEHVQAQVRDQVSSWQKLELPNLQAVMLMSF